MSKRRPSAVTAIAVLNIAFAALGLLGIVFALASEVFLSVARSRNPAVQIQRQMEAAIPGYAAIQAVQLIVGGILAVMMLVSGILMLRLNPLGRRLALIHAIANIITGIASMVYTFGYVVPGMTQFFATLAGPRQPPGMVETMKVALYFGMGISTLMSIAYPVVVLTVLSLVHVKDAFATGGQMQETDDEEHYHRRRENIGDDYDQKFESRGDGYR
jgi:hypothetical protein